MAFIRNVSQDAFRDWCALVMFLCVVFLSESCSIGRYAWSDRSCCLLAFGRFGGELLGFVLC